MACAAARAAGRGHPRCRHNSTDPVPGHSARPGNPRAQHLRSPESVELRRPTPCDSRHPGQVSRATRRRCRRCRHRHCRHRHCRHNSTDPVPGHPTRPGNPGHHIRPHQNPWSYADPPTQPRPPIRAPRDEHHPARARQLTRVVATAVSRRTRAARCARRALPASASAPAASTDTTAADRCLRLRHPSRHTPGARRPRLRP